MKSKTKTLLKIIRCYLVRIKQGTDFDVDFVMEAIEKEIKKEFKEEKKMEEKDVKTLLQILKEIEGHLKQMADAVATTQNNIQKLEPQEIPTPKKKFVENMRSGVEAFNKGIGQMFGTGTEEKKPDEKPK